MKRTGTPNPAEKLSLTLNKDTVKALHVSTSVKTGAATYPGYSYTCHPSPCGTFVSARRP